MEIFALMGEYRGWGRFSCRSSEDVRQRMGLRLWRWAMAVLPWAIGGLAGNGWDRTERDRWQGEGSERACAVARRPDRSGRRRSSRAGWTQRDGVVGTLPKVLRRSCTAGAAPPAWSIVLFDGNDTRAFKSPKVRDGLLQAGTELLLCYRDYTLHVEFCVPYMPRARGQGRGNSGVDLQSRYEIQILDSFGLAGESNECGGLIVIWPQTRTWHFPRSVGRPTTSLLVTAFRCGRPEGARCPTDCFAQRSCRARPDSRRANGAGRPETSELLPIKLQDHGNPVQFRNIWLVEHSAAFCTANAEKN